MKPNYLFREKGGLRGFLERRKKELKKEIEEYGKKYLLKIPEQELLKYLLSKYSVDPIIIHDDKIFSY